MSKKIKKLTAGIKKFITHWTRRKIILAFGVLIIGGLAAVLLWQNGYIGADVATTVPESSNVINIQLPKDLADKVKAGSGNLDALTRKSLDDLTRAKIDSVLSADTATRSRSVSDQADSANDRLNFSDLIITYQDENGKPILPDLEKLKSQSATSRAVGEVPESNKINFIIGFGWSEEEKQKIQKIIDNDVPKIRELLGPPLFNNINVSISTESLKGISGYYLSSTNQIVIDKDSTKSVSTILPHEMVHAWFDDLSLYNIFYKNGDKSGRFDMSISSAWEESIASITKCYVQYGNAYSCNPHEFELVNKPTISESLFMSSSQYKFFDFRYSYGQVPWVKMYIEDRMIFKNFITKYYLSNQSIIKISDLYEILLQAMPKNIEGIGAEEWLNSQYIIKPSLFTGKLFLPLSQQEASTGFWIINIDEKMGNFPMPYKTNFVNLTVADIQNKILAEFTCKTKQKQFGTREYDPIYDYVTIQQCLYGNSENAKKANSLYIKITSNADGSNSEDSNNQPLKYIFHIKEIAGNEEIILSMELLYGGASARVCEEKDEKDSFIKCPWYSLSSPIFSTYIDDGILEIVDNRNGAKTQATIKNGEIFFDGVNNYEKVASSFSFYFVNPKDGERIFLEKYNKPLNAPIYHIISTKNLRSSKDQQRLADIETIKSALEKYKTAEGIYPNIRGAKLPNNGWANSNDASWESLENELKPYLPSGVTSLPKDPVNTSNAWATTSNSFTYTYFSLDYGKSASCQWYMLVYRLGDSKLKTSPGVKACDGKQFQYGNGAITEGGDAITKKDVQRKSDLTSLKTALDQYYTQNKKLPSTDGWIERNGQSTLDKPLVGGKLIDQLPCDPAVKDQVKCASGGTYQYWRHDFRGIGGSDKEYSLYVKLENPTDADKATLNTGNAKMNEKAKTYGMNYRVGEVFASPEIPAVNTAPSVKITSATAKRIIFAKYNLQASWTGSDKEDKTADLVYRYKVGKGDFSAWAKTASLNKNLVFTTTAQLTVEVKDTQGAVSQASASIKLTD